jgi:hypothetical protein
MFIIGAHHRCSSSVFVSASSRRCSTIVGVQTRRGSTSASFIATIFQRRFRSSSSTLISLVAIINSIHRCCSSSPSFLASLFIIVVVVVIVGPVISKDFA